MVMGVPFMKSSGCCGGFLFNVKIIERVFAALFAALFYLVLIYQLRQKWHHK